MKGHLHHFETSKTTGTYSKIIKESTANINNDDQKKKFSWSNTTGNKESEDLQKILKIEGKNKSTIDLINMHRGEERSRKFKTESEYTQSFPHYDANLIINPGQHLPKNNAPLDKPKYRQSVQNKTSDYIIPEILNQEAKKSYQPFGNEDTNNFSKAFQGKLNYINPKAPKDMSKSKLESVSDLKSLNEKKHQKIEKLKIQKEANLSENLNLKMKNSNLDQKNKELEQNNKDLLNRFKNLEDSFDKQKKEKDYLEESYKKLKRSNENLKQTNNDLEERINELEKSNKYFKQTNNDLEQRKNEFEQSNEYFKKTNNDLEQRKNELEQSNEYFKKTNNDLEQRKNELDESNKYFKQTNNDLEQRINELKESNEKITMKMADIESKTQNNKESEDELIIILEENKKIKRDIAIYTQNNTSLSQVLHEKSILSKELKKQNIEKENQIVALNNEISALKKEINELKKHLKSSLQEELEKIKQITLEANRYSRSCSDKLIQIDQYKFDEKYNFIKENYDSLQQDINKLLIKDQSQPTKPIN